MDRAIHFNQTQFIKGYGFGFALGVGSQIERFYIGHREYIVKKFVRIAKRDGIASLDAKLSNGKVLFLLIDRIFGGFYRQAGRQEQRRQN